MSILHHPSDELLLGQAAGRLEAGPALVLGAHLAVCPACRAQVERLEAVGGALMDSIPPAAMAPDALAHALARIERPAPPAPAPRPPRGIDLAEVLAGLPVGRRRWLGPGMWMRPVERRGRSVTYLLRSGPGRQLPRHTHTGAEYVVVLKGSFSDQTGRYGPGDFAEGSDDLVHAPRTDSEGECLCLISAEGPMRMRDMIGRIAQPFFGL